MRLSARYAMLIPLGIGGLVALTELGSGSSPHRGVARVSPVAATATAGSRREDPAALAPGMPKKPAVGPAPQSRNAVPSQRHVNRSAAGSRPVTVPLWIRSGQGTSVGVRPMVFVRVGGGPSVPVLLDTGSVGLRIYSPGVRVGPGTGVRLSNRTNSITYIDGTVQSGIVAAAKVTIDGLTTSRPIELSVVQSLGCTQSKPKCPSAGGLKAAVASGSYGTLGIGLSRDPSGVGNPLLGLPVPYSRRWSIALTGTAGQLILGASRPPHPLARFALAADGTDPSGHPAWRDNRADVCWTAGGIQAVCAPTLFDSGNVGMQWSGGLLGHVSTLPGSTLVDPGTTVSAFERGASEPFWSFTTGRALSENTVRAHPSGQGAVNAAVQAFYAFTITYDAGRGEIFLSRPQS